MSALRVGVFVGYLRGVGSADRLPATWMLQFASLHVRVDRTQHDHLGLVVVKGCRVHLRRRGVCDRSVEADAFAAGGALLCQWYCSPVR